MAAPPAGPARPAAPAAAAHRTAAARRRHLRGGTTAPRAAGRRPPRILRPRSDLAPRDSPAPRAASGPRLPPEVDAPRGSLGSSVSAAAAHARPGDGARVSWPPAPRSRRAPRRLRRPAVGVAEGVRGAPGRARGVPGAPPPTRRRPRDPQVGACRRVRSPGEGEAGVPALRLRLRPAARSWASLNKRQARSSRVSAENPVWAPALSRKTADSQAAAAPPSLDHPLLRAKPRVRRRARSAAAPGGRGVRGDPRAALPFGRLPGRPPCSVSARRAQTPAGAPPTARGCQSADGCTGAGPAGTQAGPDAHVDGDAQRPGRRRRLPERAPEAASGGGPGPPRPGSWAGRFGAGVAVFGPLVTGRTESSHGAVPRSDSDARLHPAPPSFPASLFALLAKPVLGKPSADSCYPDQIHALQQARELFAKWPNRHHALRCSHCWGLLQGRASHTGSGVLVLPQPVQRVNEGCSPVVCGRLVPPPAAKHQGTGSLSRVGVSWHPKAST
ncbi:translation initiation factor IF-2-like [Cebus imitator]|uniref:translation initiation factor IF-2-like n=1 Tax=Cebus imitator TaxID=2715852 RepID=UPI001898A738|nr:translation initiation factor IF-2-like [Cebus imitator]